LVSNRCSGAAYSCSGACTKVADAEKDDSVKVAEHGFEALMAGKDHVIAGSPKNKA
jgi:hypothetical protein